MESYSRYALVHPAQSFNIHMKNTTLKISKSTLKQLRTFALTKSETNEEIIFRLVNFCKGQMEIIK